MKTFSLSFLVLTISLTVANAATNLLVNPGAENGSDGWNVTGGGRIISYTAGAGFPAAGTTPEMTDRGDFFFSGGSNNSFSSFTQTIDLSFLDWASSTSYEFVTSGWLGGYMDDNDRAQITVEFLSASSASLGSFSVGPVTAEDRGNETGFLYRELQDVIPVGATSAVFTVSMGRSYGTTNDGYAENLQFQVIPEPSMTALFAGGLAVALRRRRK